jgi:hypothetical protein
MDYEGMPPGSISDHPINRRIYGKPDPADLVESVRVHGILEPIVISSERRVLSGHRRLAAARALGLQIVPVRVLEVPDEVQAIVHFNRQRRKTCQQIARECEVLLPGLKRAADARREEGRRRGAQNQRDGRKSPRGPKRRVLDDLAQIIDIARETLRRLLLVVDAVDAGSLPADLLRRIDRGQVSINQAFRLIGKAAAAHGNVEVQWPICPFDVWEIKRRSPIEIRNWTQTDELLDRRFRRCPEDVFANLLHYFTEPGDLVVDPMAGTGAIGRVAKAMKRRTILSDLSPQSSEIGQRDAAEGPPMGMERVQLLFIDPPWGDLVRYSDDSRDLSNERDPLRFVARLREIVSNWSALVCPGGRIAVLCGGHVRGNESVDLAWSVGRMLEEFGVLERRVLVPYPYSSFQPWHVARAKAKRIMLTRIAEMVVVKTSQSSTTSPSSTA